MVLYVYLGTELYGEEKFCVGFWEGCCITSQLMVMAVILLAGIYKHTASRGLVSLTGLIPFINWLSSSKNLVFSFF